MEYQLFSICVGEPDALTYRGRQERSGIRKKPIREKTLLTKVNFSGDGQADLKNHGGDDKAVCAYSYDHYDYWKEKHHLSMTPGFFGENLTIKDLTENDVYIGDIYQIGEAKIQVCQPRIPCYKISAKTGIDGIHEEIKTTGFTGYYYRVVEEGWVSPTDTLKRVSRFTNSLSIKTLNDVLYRDKENKSLIKQITQLDGLAENWREMMAGKL